MRDWGAKSPTSAASEKGKNSFLSDEAKLALELLASFLPRFPRGLISAQIAFSKKDRHQAKDHAQLLMLRDSFLDLIPALCFHIHGWEDGSLCQGIQLIGRHKTDIRDEFQRNDRITPVPDQCKLPFALRTVDDEFRITDFFQCFNRDQLRFVFRFHAWRKRDISRFAIRVRTIERRKSKTIFCDGVFQFLFISSAINAYDMSLSQFPGSAIHPR